MVDSLTGVFVGLTHGDYQLLAADAHAVEAPYGFTGSSFSLASGRIAYAWGPRSRANGGHRMFVWSDRGAPGLSQPDRR
jgi:hypothetical protein